MGFEETSKKRKDVSFFFWRTVDLSKPFQSEFADFPSLIVCMHGRVVLVNMHVCAFSLQFQNLSDYQYNNVEGYCYGEDYPNLIEIN